MLWPSGYEYQGLAAASSLHLQLEEGEEEREEKEGNTVNKSGGVGVGWGVGGCHTNERKEVIKEDHWEREAKETRL